MALGGKITALIRGSSRAALNSHRKTAKSTNGLGPWGLGAREQLCVCSLQLRSCREARALDSLDTPPRPRGDVWSLPASILSSTWADPDPAGWALRLPQSSLSGESRYGPVSWELPRAGGLLTFKAEAPRTAKECLEDVVCVKICGTEQETGQGPKVEKVRHV